MRRRFLALTCLAAVILLTLVAVRPRTRSRINDDAIARIGHGMMRDEVEAILGAPPGDYTTRTINYVGLPAPPYRPWVYENEAEIWASDDAKVRIHFDNAGRVEGVFSDLRWEGREGLWDKVRRSLGLCLVWDASQDADPSLHRTTASQVGSRVHCRDGRGR